ncbi:hypothetical protein DF3PA_350014 [Candidatus Defluviicoccus seviourii]|uniref:Uncharacterized protein n=2 Tax=root TaxID=1 RepID=A0A564WF31_9PROT|nr:conserved hypothetical protein [uncultured Defluviicoccus sp.]VUX47082.1 hypothetical protein DF3PA_350014 [Candidatus Defluviicoccus seviourii]
MPDDLAGEILGDPAFAGDGCTIGGRPGGGGGGGDEPREPAAERVPTLPAAFWEARPELQAIRAFAHWRGVAAGAVLVQALVRTGVASAPDARAQVAAWLPEMPLSLFAAVVGPSGAGKSTAAAAARDLVAAGAGDALLDQPIGSGEGIAEAFMGEVETKPAAGRKKAETERRQVRRLAHFHVDEGEALVRLAKRDGATLGEALRRGFMGEPLGQRNASADRTRVVRDYVLGLTVNATPAVAAGLLRFAELGLPQRFLWASAIDPELPRDPERATAPVIYPAQAGVIGFPAAIGERLRGERWRAVRGEAEADELDAHATIIRARVAAILAAWDCRDAVSSDDWTLAGIVCDYSCAVRAMTIAHAEAAEGEEQAREGQRRGRVMAATFAEANAAPAKIERLAARLAAWLHATGKAATRRDLARRAKSAERHLVAAAIEHATASGGIRAEGDRFAAGGWKPA